MLLKIKNIVLNIIVALVIPSTGIAQYSFSTINSGLNKNTDDIAAKYKQSLDADSVTIAVMESHSGKIVALSEIGTPPLSFVNHVFEPGSVMKTITYALLLQNKKVDKDEIINVYNGEYQLGNQTIRDAQKFDVLSAEDVIAFSSNVGIVQLAQRLEADEFFQGLKDFGFTKKSGLDVEGEKTGQIPSLEKFDSENHKAIVGYGYGMEANFIQLLRAYNMFNNDGKMVDPYYDHSKKNTNSPKQIVSKETSDQVQQALIKTVERGAGNKAHVSGLIVGGKPGTAHIKKNSTYRDRYNTTFFGFTNNNNFAYTIGVWVQNIEKEHMYFGGVGAAPIFKEVVTSIQKNGLY